MGATLLEMLSADSGDSVPSSVSGSEVIIVDNSILANHSVKVAIAYSLFAPCPSRALLQ